MSDAELRGKLIELLRATAAAHHAAFEATDGEDPEWPLWYAERLAEPLGELLGQPFTRSHLVACLEAAEQEHAACDPESDWAAYYAHYFEQCFAPSSTAAQDALALYHYPSCGFCRLVRRVIDELGLKVELRDIHADRQHWDALVAARGRPTVPVLHIASPGGAERWMPESRDIATYLRRCYG